jgi:cytochrome c biogenesis protein CcdA
MQKTASLLLTLAAASGLFAAPASKLVITFFGSPACDECITIREQLLKPLQAGHPSTLDIHFRNVEDPKDLALLTTMEKGYKVGSSPSQELYFPDTVLLGYDAIMRGGGPLVEKYLAHPEIWAYRHAYGDSTIDTVAAVEAMKEQVGKLTFIGLFAIGFVDGINPCAIATMIFLISFLGTQQRTRRDVLKIGLAFTGTVFITYLSIGLGVFKMLTLFKQNYWVSFSIRAIAVGVAVWVAVVSIWDAVRYYRTHDAREMKMQLPKGVKMLIHGVIKGNLTSNKLVAGAVITGFLVTLLMGVCTAKIYLPTIVAMTKNSTLRLRGWLLLILYNFLFVLPLLIVMVCAAFGMKWNRLSKFTQKHLALMKVLLALVMFALVWYITAGK